MRLKTKFQDEDFDLGEVVEANVYYGGNGRIKVIAEPAKGGMITFYFETLKGMNELFEDYEEPEEYWYIKHDGCITITCGGPDDDMKQIGNYFGTREEAKRAVEKLKALKRLKDEGMEIYSFEKRKAGIDLDFYTLTILAPRDKDSLDLLFGGE